MTRKKKSIIKVKAGVVCPICQTERGDARSWLQQALGEFYHIKPALVWYDLLLAEFKQDITGSAQAISVLGHFQDACSLKRHPQKVHTCTALVEIGCCQAVELLNRGLLHATIGCPSPGLALYRMALEVGVRSLLAEIIYAYLAGKTRQPFNLDSDTKIFEYLRQCRTIIEKTGHKDFYRCSEEMLYINWPVSKIDTRTRKKRGPELDPFRLGWGKVLEYIKDLHVFKDGDRMSAALQDTYDSLSVFVHQKISSTEAAQSQNGVHGIGWIIRGLLPADPQREWLVYPQKVVDILIALVIKTQVNLSFPIANLKKESECWLEILSEWHALPLTVDAINLHRAALTSL